MSESRPPDTPTEHGAAKGSGDGANVESLGPLLEHAEFLRRLSRRLVSQEDDAVELEQSTWLVALQRPPRYFESVRGWLSTVLRNLSREQHRGRKRREEREKRAAKPDLHEDSTGRELILREVTEAVLDLDPAYREIVFLRYYEDLPPRDIAARLQIPVETVRTRLKRAHGRLRNTLDDSFDSDRRAWLIPLIGLFDSHYAQTLASATVSTTAAGIATTGWIAMNAKLKIGIVVGVAAVAATLYWVDSQRKNDSNPEEVAIQQPAPDPVSPETDQGVDDAAPTEETVEPILVKVAVDPVRGRVVHAVTGAPLGDARVVAMEKAGFYFEAEVVAEAVTDAEGWFDLMSVDARRLGTVLRFSKDGFVPHDETIQSGSNHREVRLTPGIVVTGELVFEDGTPARGGWATQLRGLTVNPGARAPFGHEEAMYSSFDHAGVAIDENGRFRTATNEPLIGFEVRSTDSAPAFSEVIEPKVDGENHLVIRVRRGTTLTGRVIDTDGKTVSGARVVCFPAIEDVYPDHLYFTHFTRMEATSRLDGSFEIDHMPSRYSGYQVVHPDHATLSVFNQLKRTVEPLTTTLDAGRRVRLRLSSAGDPVVLDAHDIALFARNRSIEFEQSDDGVVTTGAVPSEAARLRLRARGWEQVEIDLPTESGLIDLGTIELISFASLKVIVLGTASEPVSGATVTSVVMQGTVPQSDARATDASGSATVFLAGDEGQIRVDHPDYTVVTQPFGNTEEVRIQLEPCATISGSVVDGKNNPVAGAKVWISYRSEDGPGRWRTPVVSSAQGQYELRGVLPDRPFVVHAKRDGYREATASWESVAVGSLHEAEALLLATGSVIRGVVRDDTGSTIAGAIVGVEKIERTFRSGMPRNPWAVSDHEGRYQIAGLDSVRYAINVRAVGYRPARADAVLDGDELEMDFTLEPKSTVQYTARVVDEDGAPIGSASIDLGGKAAGSETWGGSGYSAADGTFTIDDVPPASLTVEVRADGFVATNLRVPSSKLLPSEIVLTRGAILEMAISATGSRPLPAYVRYNLSAPRGSRSASVPLVHGVATLSGLSDGEGHVVINAHGFPRSEQVPVVLENGRVTRVEIVLDGDAVNVSVRVVDAAGQPIIAADASLKAGDGSHSTTARTNESGIAQSANFLIDDGAWFEVEAAGYARATVRELLGRVRNGVIDVVLEPESALEIEVLELDGTPIDEIDVRVTAGEVAATGYGMDPQTKTGRARIGHLLPGTYTVELRRGRETLHQLTIELAAGEVRSETVRLDPPIVFSGTLTRNGRSVSNGSLEFRSLDGTARNRARLSDGKFRLTLRGKGQFEIEYTPRRGRAAKTVIDRSSDSVLGLKLEGIGIVVE